MHREKIVIPAPGPAPLLRMDLLGRAEISLGETALTGQLPGKALALLAYLALSRRPHLRPALAALLWSETNDEDALASLRQALAKLRRAVGSHLLIARQTVAFNHSAGCLIDVDLFLAEANDLPVRLDAAAAVRLGDALARYGGELLHGLALREAPLFEEWLTEQRERLRECALRALAALMDYHTARGAPEAARDYGQRLLLLDPWREDVYRALMRLLAQDGRRSAALALFETCRRTLEEQLGLEPAAETVELYRLIRDSLLPVEASPAAPVSATELAPAPRHNLPAQPTSFVGRLAELDDIQRLLAHPECRLVTLAGMGGAGKTRLAIEAAREQLCAFRDGAFFVPLAAAQSADQIVAAIGQALSLPPAPHADPRAALLDALRPRQILLVLDNLEHLLEESDLLVALLEQAPGLKLIATSRLPLELRWEWLLELEGLECPPEPQAAPAPPERPLADYGAARLFLDRAAQLRRPFEPDLAERAAVARICRLACGLPLLIELAAAALGSQSCAALADSLAGRLHALETRLRDLPARHRSVQAVLDHSWRLLDPAQQRSLRALAVFRPDMSEEAAAQVAGADPATLERLVAMSLLRRSGPGRYALHELVREYAATRLAESDEKPAAQATHGAFYGELAAAAFAGLGGPQQRDWLERLEREHDNLRAALDWMVQSGDAVAALRLAGRLGRFWLLRGHFAEGRRWLGAALAVPPGPSPVAEEGRWRGLALYSAGVLAHTQGDYAEARARFLDNLALRRASGDRRGLAVALNSLGGIAVTEGDDAAAARYFGEALLLHQELGEQENVGAVLGNLGAVAVRRGDYARGEGYLEQSLALARGRGDQRGETVILFNQGDLRLRRGDLDGAEERLLAALRGYRALGDRLAQAECLEKLGQLAAARGHPEQLARLCGTADAARAELHAPVAPEHRAPHEAALQRGRAALGEAAWARAWEAGRTVRLADAVEAALDESGG
ncbi:MAG TPA: BTAD domain-containing putative transcriptional regulator [Roseiflexaceae bacterium]|nr:BTAD domain-containing putative transcriptional regulator [Roseiflexaceae bacterium]